MKGAGAGSSGGLGKSLALSGRTRAYLAKAEGGKKGEETPIVVQDAETGEECTLLTVPAVVNAALPEHKRAKGPQTSTDLIPELGPAALRDKAVLIRVIKEHQRQQLGELIGREAKQEAMRRDILKKEDSKWRRDVMKKSFVEERIAAAEEIKKLKMDQEIALVAKLKEFGLVR
jgi:hypothetical protein